jgi:hypothetical protein
MTNRQRARELVASLGKVLTRNMEPEHIQEFENDITSALDRASKPAPGHVRDSDGVDRKVLGTLPMTKDNCVIGDGAYVWFMLPGVKGRDDDTPCRIMFKPCPIVDPDSYNHNPRGHSTRESLLAKGARDE